MIKSRVFLKTLLLISLLCAGAYLIFSSIALFIVSDSRTNPLWPYAFLALGLGCIYSFYRINKKSDTKAAQIISGYFAKTSPQQMDMKLNLSMTVIILVWIRKMEPCSWFQPPSPFIKA